MQDTSLLGSMGGSLRLRGRPRPHLVSLLKVVEAVSVGLGGHVGPHLGSLVEVDVHFGEHDAPILGVALDVIHRVSITRRLRFTRTSSTTLGLCFVGWG